MNEPEKIIDLSRPFEVFFAENGDLRWFGYPLLIVGGLLFAVAALVGAGIGGILIFGGIGLAVEWAQHASGSYLVGAAVFAGIFILLGVFAEA